MKRDYCKSSAYWDRCYEQEQELLVTRVKSLKKPAGPNRRYEYDTMIAFNLARGHWELMLIHYSRGNAIDVLGKYFPGLLQAWEESNRLSREINQVEPEFPWNNEGINGYLDSFWLIGLALILNIPDDQWQRLLALIGNEGEDILLDRIVATRQPDRKIGTKLCHPRPYARLLAAIEAPSDQQVRKLSAFVDNWYRELKRRNSDNEPYWYNYHECPNEWCNYFGYWCVEAVAAVKAFGLDDRLCLGHPHYPGDLLRPDGPTTHVPCSEEQWARALGKPLPKKEEEQGGWLTRWYHGLRDELSTALGGDKKKRRRARKAP